MSYEWIDILTYYLFGLRGLTWVLAVVLLVLGFDDLLMDIVYWLRRVVRYFRFYRGGAPDQDQLLLQGQEQPLAVMVPAWQEVGVIGEMARLAASSLDYENYQIFVGTYPNDPATQAEVDEVCARYSHVHKVICARPGPTSKADCLNNIIEAIQRFEQQAGVQFAGFVLHDAEDVIEPLELRLFNFMLPRKDLIQVPVYPYAKRWWQFTAGHYVDEFAELHGKDIVLREALVGQVPSAGVGTCFSRKAIKTLLTEGDGIAFDVQSLTEDYDIGLRLKQKGMSEVFARFSVQDRTLSPFREEGFGRSSATSRVICVREHFPDTFEHAVKQKARWITGIVFQGSASLGWSTSPLLNYFLWRDRRGAVINLIGLLSTLVFIQLLAVWLLNGWLADSWRFDSVLGHDPLLHGLLTINGFLLLNRLFQRGYFVTRYYGLWQGLLSIPRMVWSNVVNFFANLRAIRLVLKLGDARKVAWDKTSHELPALANTPRRTPLGQILVAQGAISEEQLSQALYQAPRRLGRELLVRGWVTGEQLAAALATQAELPWRPLDLLHLDSALIEAFPARLALRYSLLPVDEVNGRLLLGSERAPSPVVLGVIARQLGRPVDCCIVPPGRVTLGLHHWYLHPHSPDMQRLLEALRAPQAEPALQEQVCRHLLLLGDLLQELGMLPPALLAQVLIEFEPEQGSLGQTLLKRGLISAELLQQALDEQQAELRRALALIEEKQP